MNWADPWTEMDGERSHARSRHPSLTDPAVREAMSLLVDRKAIEQHIFGRIATATPNFLNRPAVFRSPNTTLDFNPEKAARLLEKRITHRPSPRATHWLTRARQAA